MPAPDSPVQKRYIVNGNQFYYHNSARPGAPIKESVEVFYQFKNEEKGGLGIPMPAGTVRVYQSDSNGGVQFVGEDRIYTYAEGRSAESEDWQCLRRCVRAEPGRLQKIAPNVYEIEYAISLRNRKSTPITVEVNEPVGAATWRMLELDSQVDEDHRLSRRNSWCRSRQGRSRC